MDAGDRDPGHTPTSENADLDELDLGDRRCPRCGVLMLPVDLRSGEIGLRCPNCEQRGI